MSDTSKNKVLSNTAYTMGGALVLNGVLQLLLYPTLNRSLGSDGYGTILYLMAFVNILGPSVGQALNNSRLVLRRTKEVKNGDYTILLLFFSLIGSLGTVLIARQSIGRVGDLLLLILLIVCTVFRYYGDVEYRLNLDYRSYFLYYLFCSVGYVVGFLLFRVTDRWPLIFLCGEGMALLFIGLKGTVFQKFFLRGKHFSFVVQKGSLLVGSYFITNLALNIDRLYLKSALGAEDVSTYYVVSLIGKTLVLFVAPVNTIMISYLTHGKSRMTNKRFLILAGAGVVVSTIFFFFCQFATPVFIRLFYPNLADSAGNLISVANLTQILAMLSAYLFIVVLTFTEEKWQLVLQCGHLALLVILMIYMTQKSSLMGFALAVLIANLIRVVMVLLLGLIGSGGSKGELYGKTGRRNS